MLLFLAFALANQSAAPTDAARDKLIAESVDDLKAHLPGAPRDFRSVRLAWRTDTDRGVLPVICGKVLAATTPEKWIRFAALTTSGYEQYFGDGSQGWCDRADKKFGSRDITKLFRERLAAAK
jgi:hypothetical protein